MKKMMIAAKIKDMYAMTAKILDKTPLNLYRLKEIVVIATTSRKIPKNEIHIFMSGLIPMHVTSIFLQLSFDKRLYHMSGIYNTKLPRSI